MSLPTIQVALSAGELSPSLYGRVDLEKTKRGTSTCRNMFASYRGGAYSRAGTAFAGICLQGNRGTANAVAPPRNFTFQYSAHQGIAIEAGDQYFRFLSNGAYITEAPVALTAISNADPGVVTAPGNAFVNGDEVFLSGIVGPIGLRLNNRSFLVYYVSGATFTLVNTLDGMRIDTRVFGAYSSGGTAARIYTLTTPYAAADLRYLKFAQSADVMSLTLVNMATHTEYPPYDLARIASDYWTLTPTTFRANIQAPASIWASETDSGISTPSFYYQFVATAVDITTGEESVASPVGTVLAVDMSSEAATITLGCGTQANAGSYNFYGAPESYKTVPSAGALFGYLGSGFGPTFTDTNVIADFTKTPPLHRNPFAPGAILAVPMTNAGGSYDPLATTATATSPTGDDASLTPVVVNGSIEWTVVNTGGSGYTGGETVYFASGGSSTNAAGSIDFSASGTPDSSTITLNGDVWTFVNTVVAANQVPIDPMLGTTLSYLQSALTGSSDPQLTVSSYTVTATELFITYDSPGSVGTTYSLAASVAVVSNPTLVVGGGAGGAGAAATLTVGPATGIYPSCVAYFQQRRLYADTLNQPDTYFASQPGAFTNMDVSLPTIDSDSITGTPWSQQVNGIQWMLNMPGGLVIFTGLGAWQLSGAGGGLATSAPLTPANQVANPQAYNGCSPTVPPIPINYDILYEQEKGSIVRDLSYNFFVNIYTGTDMTVLSNHLFDGHLILEWGWAEEPNKLLWAVREDGILLCLTYLKEQDVYAWTRHDTQGLYQSVCTVSEPPVNAPYFITKRLIANNGNPSWVYFQERMDDRLWNNQETAWCVDAGLAYPQSCPNATITVSSAAGVPVLSQLSLVYGGANYSAQTYAVVNDPTGTGAVPSVTVVGGVVTTASVSGTLFGYTDPVFRITDPTGAGGGAVANIGSTLQATLIASSPVFANVAGQGEAGDVIRMGGRTMEVAEYLSPTVLNVIVVRNEAPVIPNDPNNTPVPAMAGSWSIAAPVSTLYGLDHLEGMRVSILADGVLIAPQVVTAGQIVLPQPASAIVAGLGFAAQVQTLYLDVAGPATVQGRRKSIESVIARVTASGTPFEVGANQPDAAAQPGQVTVPWTNMTAVQGAPSSNHPLQPYDFVSADIFTPVSDVIGATGGQVALQQTGPIPLNVLALIINSRLGDDPDAG
jgi:hypothetical protein